MQEMINFFTVTGNPLVDFVFAYCWLYMLAYIFMPDERTWRK